MKDTTRNCTYIGEGKLKGRVFNTKKKSFLISREKKRPVICTKKEKLQKERNKLEVIAQRTGND